MKLILQPRIILDTIKTSRYDYKEVKTMRDKILTAIKAYMKESDFQNCHASSLSNIVKINRIQVATVLNELASEGVLVKIMIRPVLFLDKDVLLEDYQKDIHVDSFSTLEELDSYLHDEVVLKDFDNLIGYNDSLNSLVEKMKATLCYPPIGLPILLYGPTGTGKSYMAKLAYEYCINSHLITNDKKFIQVNCSEYANNPELLTANLFGYKKGAFTGADKDNLGLLHYANGGVLFLDEVHCLKSECQEKLFLYMDQGIYHLVGDNEQWHKASCRIIFATTETPEQVLLKTLLRRIPVVLTIPSLEQRGINERMQLIYHLYKKEEKRIHKQIKISSNVQQILLSYVFHGNIGELNNAIQSSCVNALFNQTESVLEIHAYHLPETIMEVVIPSTLFMQKHQMICLDSLLLACTFDGVVDFYKTLISYIGDTDFDSKVNTLIDEYFEKIVFNKKESTQKKYFLDTVSQVLDMITSRFGFVISHNEIVAITSYILEYNRNTYAISSWIQTNKQTVSQLEKYIELKYHREYLISKEAYDYFKYNVNDDLDEMVLCVLSLCLHKYFNHDAINQTVSIILAHGFSTASSISESVNKLLDTYIFDAIDMPLNVDSASIVVKINDYLSYFGKVKQLYLLVDMGSLEEIYQGIQGSNMDIGLINNVHTKLALQIGEGIKNNLPMKTIFESVAKEQPHYIHLETLHQKEPVILCSCASGLGAANKLKTIISDSLPPTLEIKVLTYDYMTLIEKHMHDDFFSDYDVICVIGTLNPNIENIRFIAIEDLIINTGYEKLELYFHEYLDSQQLEQFEKNILKNFSLSNVMNNLTILNPNKLLEHVSAAIETLQKLLNIQFKNHTCFGLYVHLCCLIERLITFQAISVYSSQDFEQKQQDFIHSVKEAMIEVEKFYNVNIPNEEIEYIYDYIKNN